MKEIEKLVKEISEKLQALENLLNQKNIPKVDLVFPRGVVRTANDFRNRLNFISDPVLKSNIAYSLMFTDFLRWILNRFDVAFTLKEMLIKSGISLIGYVIEAILKHILKDPNAGIDRCCTELVKKGIISQDLKKNIKWVWNRRCKEHLITVKEIELQKYELKDYNKAILTWQELERVLYGAKINRKI
ncbi:MAG: hypothetical protein NC926_09690 [Candidatus Omnitrophica bacterium]|nr:hypothetical protein [Candidatus Omnitrophota bacterium]